VFSGSNAAQDGNNNSNSLNNLSWTVITSSSQQQPSVDNDELFADFYNKTLSSPTIATAAKTTAKDLTESQLYVRHHRKPNFKLNFMIIFC